jgi:hypothetical protein
MNNQVKRISTAFLMFDRRVQVPKGYAERGCMLVSYRLPGVPHCFSLCHEGGTKGPPPDRPALTQFFVAQAESLAEAAVGDAQAFLLIHGGASVRRRANWHLHVFVLQHGWQKAWLYAILTVRHVLRTLGRLADVAIHLAGARR